MPYIKIETSTALAAGEQQAFLKKASSYFAAMLGKPEQWVMVAVHAGVPLLMSGSDGPAAYIELKSIGLQEKSCPGLSEKICDFIAGELAVAPERVYIEFCDINGKMFGWNRKTF